MLPPFGVGSALRPAARTCYACAPWCAHRRPCSCLRSVCTCSVGDARGCTASLAACVGGAAGSRDAGVCVCGPPGPCRGCYASAVTNHDSGHDRFVVRERWVRRPPPLCLIDSFMHSHCTRVFANSSGWVVHICRNTFRLSHAVGESVVRTFMAAPYPR